MIREDILNSLWTGNHEDEQLVTRIQRQRVAEYLQVGMDVIVSDTNLPDRSVKQWMQFAHEHGATFDLAEFRDVPLETVLARNRERGGKKFVPEDVIRDKYNRFVKGKDLSQPVEWSPKPVFEVVPYEQPEESRYPRLHAVIFDIDGTLAVMGDRSPYDGEKVWMDTPNADVVRALNLHIEAGHTIYIVSGRDEVYREVTEKWLADNGIQYDALLMRPTEQGPKREDSIIKHELFNKHIRPLGLRIVGVYDDRHRVLRMWRQLGLTTFHVNGPDAGDF
jgi:hypothetical protein